MRYIRIEMMNMLEALILLGSHAYYSSCNDSPLTDGQYDEACSIMTSLKDKYPDEFERTVFYDVFWDFTGETGYYLNNRLCDSQIYLLELIADLGPSVITKLRLEVTQLMKEEKC